MRGRGQGSGEGSNVRGTGPVEVEEEGWVCGMYGQRGEGDEFEGPGFGVRVGGVFGGEELGKE